MKKIYMIIFLLFSIIYGCSKEARFTERIIDSDAPKDIFMKTIGDINGDSKIDILVGGNEKGGIVAYLAPTWEKQILCDTIRVGCDAEVCDLDNNKSPDVVAIVNKALVWLSGPDWNLYVIDSVDIHDIEVNDYNNDGLIDVIGRNQAEWGRGDTLFIYQQKPLGMWIKYKKVIENGEGLISADINGDKKKDIGINGYWFENTGNIQVWKEHKFNDAWKWRNTYIDVADMNNDGLPDLLLSPSELAKNRYHISWFEAPKDPTTIWKEHIVVDSIESVIHFIGAADFNMDGKMDIMIAEMQQGSDPDEVAVFYQERDNNWKKQVISTGGCHSIRLFDFDGDGDTDAFGANWRENIVKMWINEIK